MSDVADVVVLDISKERVQILLFYIVLNVDKLLITP